MAEVTLRNVAKRFGAVEIIHDASIAVKDGEFVVFVGPSGCGIMAGSVLLTLPMLVVFVALQRHFIAGIASGAVN